MKHTSRLAERVVAALDAREINPYISVAKLVLWVVGLALFGVLLGSVIALAWKQDPAYVGNIVGAGQALTVIALSIMGWHGYKGSQALYLLRHLGERDILNSAPDPTPKPDEGKDE